MTGIIIPDPAGGLVWIHGSDGSATPVKVLVTAAGKLRIEVDASALPTDSATQTTLAALLTELQQKLETADLTLEAGNLAVNARGRISSAWQRQPLIFGFSAVYAEVVSDLNAAAGTNTLSCAAVPANTLRVVTQIHVRDQNNANTRIHIELNHNGTVRTVERFASPAAAVGSQWRGHLYLDASDILRADLLGCTLNDDIFLEAHGYDMDLAAA